MNTLPRYDMAVIGGGAAGLAAAIMSANLGARTILIERYRTGGECTFTGCVPSKTLLHVARLLHEARAARDFASVEDITPNFAAIMQHVRSVRERVYAQDDAPEHLERRGIEVARGRARFTGPHELEVTSDHGDVFALSFRYAIVATGSDPALLRTAMPALTNETLFELEELPRTFAIAGAGPVGVEIAQAFARLGSDVTIVAPESRILPKDDAECVQVVQQALQRDGVRLLFGRSATDYREQHGSRVVHVDDGAQIQADALLAAVGRTPRVDDLGLTSAGVSVHDGKIVHDESCRTSAKHIFVAGDVADWYKFTHAGEHMSRVAVTNALLRVPMKLDGRHMCWSTFTSPELAHAGETEERLQQRDARYDVHRFPYARIDRAVTESRTEGLIKVLADRRGRVLGTTIAGERAGDMIAEWQLAIKKRVSLRELSGTIHAYPTYALGAKRLADEWYASRVASSIAPIARRLFRYGG